MNSHRIALTARVVGNKVKIEGKGTAQLPKDSGAHRFNFCLAGPPGLDVQFGDLDTQDDCSTCPPAAGKNSRQIVGVKIEADGHAASFTDNNNNKNGPMDVCYQWHFKCSDPRVEVEPFDPIINNGGTTTI